MDIIKKTSLIWAVMLIITFAAACSPAGATTGGVEKPAENINLRDVDISVDGDQTVVTLSLLSGSRVAGYPESKLTQPPAYQITALANPNRLMVQLDDISFWDYEQKTSWDLTGLVAGFFHEVPAKDSSLIVYIQLTQEATYTVEESEGNLIIHLSKGAVSGSSSYFCVTNAFNEHQEGTWPTDIDMTPVLCSDKKNKLLISQPFASQAEAESYQQSISEELKQALPDKAVSVIQLQSGALPDYMSDVDYSASEGRSVLLKDGRLMDTPVLLQNGRFLAAAKDGTIAFSRVSQSGEPALEQDDYLMSESLWIEDPNGRIQNMDTPDFFYIDNAAFSFDGRYLALLDVSVENRVLYVYDFSAKTLLNMGEEGFGSQTSSFTWSDSEDALYGMSGDESLQLKVCKFAEDGNFGISAVEEQAGDEGNLAATGQRVFFADSVKGMVYEMGGNRQEIIKGIDLKISPDGSKLLILETTSAKDEEVLTSLSLYDIATGDTSVIVNSAEIVDFCFVDNGKVYYTDASVQQTADGYPYGLYVYDVTGGGAPELLALSTTPDMTSAYGKLYFNDYIGEGDDGFYATYTFDPNK